MNLTEFSEIIGGHLELNRYAGQNGRWTAKFYNSETKESGRSVLESTYGEGKSPEAAMVDYVRKIRGRQLIFMASSAEFRRTYFVPSDLV